ncbi:MAG: PQQ-binding-like beta-propeller repeat protein [Phycisphaerae bacterium]
MIRTTGLLAAATAVVFLMGAIVSAQITTVVPGAAPNPTMYPTSKPSSGPATKPTHAAVSPEKVAELVKQLGDGDYKARDTAQKELTEIGEPARAELEKAAASNDLEVKQRAGAILAEIHRLDMLRASQAVEKKHLWAFEVKGGALGSPVVADGKAFIVGADRKVYAVDVKTGKEVWKYADVGDGPMPLGEPVVTDGLVIVSDRSKALHAIDASTGKLSWKFESQPAGNQNQNQNQAQQVKQAQAMVMIARAGGVDGIGQPSAAGGRVFVMDMNDKQLHAIDARTGKRAWEVNPGQMPVGRLAAGDNAVCVTGMDGSLTAFNPKTGDKLWTEKNIVNPTGLAVNGDMVCYVSQDSLVAREAATGKETWTYKLPNPAAAAGGNGAFMAQAWVNGRMLGNTGGSDGPLAIADGAIHVLAGEDMLAVDAKTGKKKWQYAIVAKDKEEKADDQPQGQGVIRQQVVVQGGVGGQIVFNNGGAVVRMVIGPNGQMIMEGASMSLSPVVGPETAYVANSDGILAVSLKDGRRLWKLKTSQVAGRGVLADGVLYFNTTEPAAGNIGFVNVAPAGQAVQPEDAKEGDKPSAKDTPGLHALNVK